MSAIDLKKRIQERQQAQRARPAQAQLDAMEELTGKPIPPTARPLLNALTIEQDGTLMFGQIMLTRVGLHIPEHVPPEQVDTLFDLLLGLTGSIQWMLGDALAYAQDRQYGESYKVSLHATTMRLQHCTSTRAWPALSPTSQSGLRS
jgi:hypothetical protein